MRVSGRRHGSAVVAAGVVLAGGEGGACTKAESLKRERALQSGERERERGGLFTRLEQEEMSCGTGNDPMPG